MAKTHVTNFAVGDKVLIKELDSVGVITSIIIYASSIMYNVRYFHDNTAKDVYFYADELDWNEHACSINNCGFIATDTKQAM